MIVLDYRDRRPLYEQVTERFKELIFREILPQDSQLPSVRSLAAELSINPNTIQRAYAQLERQGYIYSVKGKGSFVAAESRIRVQMVRDWGSALRRWPPRAWIWASGRRRWLTGYGIWQRGGGPEAGQRMSGKKPEAGQRMNGKRPEAERRRRGGESHDRGSESYQEV